jgi:ABC-type uncharacterized transport system substrate-binding protein
MTDRRVFVCAGALAVAWPLAAYAQKASPLPRIGVLIGAPSTVDAAFLAGLRELGYVDGRNVIIERRSADGDYAKLPTLAAELVGLKPNVIASVVTQASIAAKEATSTIPIVIVAVSDPVTAGLVGNLSRPGNNVTGTAVHLHDAVGKQVELMRQVVPRLARIAVIWNPDNAVFQQQSLGEALISAARARIVAQPFGVRSREDLERTFATLPSERVDAVLVLQDPVMSANRAQIAELVTKHRLPTFSGFRLLTEAGIVASYGPDLRVMGKRASVYVQRILKGAKPSDLPIELPTRLELVINARAADAIGLPIPPSVLARADDVIR